MNRQKEAFRFVGIRNAVTYFSLLAGFLSVVFAAYGQVHVMAGLWVVSVIADVFDGAFARLFGGDEADRSFGIELDSFVDALAFGGFPVAGLFLLQFAPESGVSLLFLASSMAYLIAAVTRLGHYNLGAFRGQTDFLGLPTTQAALVLATAMLAPHIQPYVWAVLILLSIAMLMPVRILRLSPTGRLLYLIWPVLVLGMHLYAHDWAAFNIPGIGW